MNFKSKDWQMQDCVSRDFCCVCDSNAFYWKKVNVVRVLSHFYLEFLQQKLSNFYDRLLDISEASPVSEQVSEICTLGEAFSQDSESGRAISGTAMPIILGRGGSQSGEGGGGIRSLVMKKPLERFQPEYIICVLYRFFNNKLKFESFWSYDLTLGN